jgi:hypothetical protein
MLMGGTLLLTAGGLAGMVLGQSAAIGQNAWSIAAVLGVCGLFSLRRARRV